MFSRAFPRMTLRTASRAAQCERNPQVHIFSKLRARTWQPIQRPCRRQENSTSQALRHAAKTNPFQFWLAISIIVGVSCVGIFYIPYYYKHDIIEPYKAFPDPVAKKLRKAVFYSFGQQQDVREANKWFRLALEEAHDLGMDPFSDEILGVKIAISALFEKVGQYPLAADVLEILRTDCLAWVEELGDKHWNDGKRTRVLKRAIEFTVQLGKLYDLEYINQPEDAEKRLTEAVTLMLSEKQRRERDGVQQGEGDWMTDEELGATMEALATHYEQNNAHYLATPLYLQALTLCPPKSCHRVILMNNIASCLAQQQPPPTPTPAATASAPSKSGWFGSKSQPPPEAKPDESKYFPSTPALSKAEMLNQARQWGNKALSEAAIITPPARNEECDLGCAVATHNLGEFFEMEGKIQEARQKYEEAESLSKALGFKEGRVNARAGLTRLKTLEKTVTA